MLRDIMRVARVDIGDFTAEATCRCPMANLGVPVEEQPGVMGVLLLGYESSTGSQKSMAGATIAKSGANVVITKPTSDWADNDVFAVGFVFGHIPEATGTLS